MKRFELSCQYCANRWFLDYMPNEQPKCDRCNDTNIRVKDLAKSKIDYYQGAPAFEEKTKEIKLEDPDPPTPDDADRWFFRGGDLMFNNSGFTVAYGIEKLTQDILKILGG